MKETQSQSRKENAGERLLSYVSPQDGLLRRSVIGGLERLSGRRRLERLYRQIQAMDIPPTQIWGEALRLLDIRFELDAAALAAVSAGAAV